MRGKMVEVVCACGCGEKCQVREADRKRGWGKYASKSCKAKAQEKRKGQYKALLSGGNLIEDYDPGDSMYWDSKD